MLASRWMTRSTKRCQGDVARVALSDSSRDRLWVPRNRDPRKPPGRPRPRRPGSIAASRRPRPIRASALLLRRLRFRMWSSSWSALKDALGTRAAAFQEAQITVTDKQGQQAIAAIITAESHAADDHGGKTYKRSGLARRGVPGCGSFG